MKPVQSSHGEPWLRCTVSCCGACARRDRVLLSGPLANERVLAQKLESSRNAWAPNQERGWMCVRCRNRREPHNLNQRSRARRGTMTVWYALRCGVCGCAEVCLFQKTVDNWQHLSESIAASSSTWTYTRMHHWVCRRCKRPQAFDWRRKGARYRR